MAVMIEEVQVEVTNPPSPPAEQPAKARTEGKVDVLGALEHAREREMRLKAD